MNTIDYENEVMRQLNDQEFYKRILSDPTRHASNLIRIVVQDAFIMDLISETLAGFLINKQPRVPIFYVLPKIHKGGFPPGATQLCVGILLLARTSFKTCSFFFKTSSGK